MRGSLRSYGGLGSLRTKIDRAVAAGSQCLNQVLYRFYVTSKFGCTQTNKANKMGITAPKRVITVRLHKTSDSFIFPFLTAAVKRLDANNSLQRRFLLIMLDK